MKNFFRFFQSVRWLADDLVTRLDTNDDLALKMRNLTELHWARDFFSVKWRLSATPTLLKSSALQLGLENSGIYPWSVGSLDNCFGFNSGMNVVNGSEGGGKLICKVRRIGGRLCVDWGSENVTFGVVNIIVGDSWVTRGVWVTREWLVRDSWVVARECFVSS